MRRTAGNVNDSEDDDGDDDDGDDDNNSDGCQGVAGNKADAESLIKQGIWERKKNTYTSIYILLAFFLHIHTSPAVCWQICIQRYRQVAIC